MLDLVTNDAGDMVRREHARDLGAGVVVAIYRLAKLAQMHDLGNQAFLRQLEDGHRLIQEYCLRSGGNVNVLFARRAVFVAGQLLKGSRGVYESAAELAEILEWCGGAELTIARDVTVAELKAFAEAIGVAMRAEKGKGYRAPSPRIRLREVTDAARLRGLELEDLSFEQRVVRTYASAVVVMRRFFEDLREGRYELPRRIKRIAQSLVDLSEGSTPALLGVTEARNANQDEAGKAVNAAILAVAVAREITSDRGLLAQIAMAAMMRDSGRPRAAALARGNGPGMTGVVAKLSEDAEDKLAAGTAAVLTTLGRVNEATITRTVIAYEALWLRRAQFIGPLYRGVRAATLQAKIVHLAHRYNDLVTPEPGLAPPTPDFAIATLWEELKEPSERTVLRMLVAALGLYPIGTVVQLTTGEVAEVVGGADARASLAAPRVRLVMDAHGGVIDRRVEVDLASASNPPRAIAKVMSVDGWRKGLESPGDAQSLDAQRGAPSAPPAPGADGERVSGPSYPSFGSSPSQVAEAFGRMMVEPRAPISVAPPSPSVKRVIASRPPADRTVVARSPFEDAQDDDRPSIIRSMQTTPRRDPLQGATPTAEGTLAATPLVHTLVYVLDHSLSGTVVFREPDGTDSMIYFANGAPAQARVGRPVTLLGDELVGEGIVPVTVMSEAIASASRLGTLLGEYLVGRGVLSADALAFALSRQLKKKLAALSNLEPETTYAFYADVNALEAWGGGQPIACHPLDAVLACVRSWHDRARVHATLGRIGRQELALHADVDLSALTLTPEEEAALAVLRVESPTLQVLLKSQIGDEDAIGSLVYTLAVTRQFAFAKGPPMGREHATVAAGADWTGDRASALPFSAIVDPSSSRERPKAVVEQVVTRRAETWRPPKTPESVPSEEIEVPIDVDEDELDAIEAVIDRPPASMRVERASVAPPRVTPDPRGAFVPQEPRASQLPPRASQLPPHTSQPPPDGEKRTTSTAALEAMTDFRLAETALQRSDLATAERFAQRAVDGDPAQPDHNALLLWIRAAKATSAAGTTDAISGLTRLLKDSPTNERALLYRGKLYKRAHKVREALRDFEAILDLNPKHSEAASEARLMRSRKK